MKTLIVSAIAAIYLGAAGTAFAADPGDNGKRSIKKWRKTGYNNAGTADIKVPNSNDIAV